MNRSIANITLVVADYDEAINYYTQKLKFELIEDSDLGEGKRWITVSPGGTGTTLLLAKAASVEQHSYVGNQTGGRVFLFLHTDDFWQDYKGMKKEGVKFLEEPREEAYGAVVVFEDLYGNKWDLLELK